VTSDAVLVLAWLVLAHLTADFLLQTGTMVADKFTTGRRAWRGLAAHGAAVALCLTPFAAAYGARGALLVVVVAVSHVLIDRWKVRATRHAEAQALAEARRRYESAPDGEGLGSAWTPMPGALFLVDQLLHLAVTIAAWLVLIAPLQPTAEWVAVVNRVLVGTDPATVHRWALVGVVVASLVIVNVRAAALFVATLVHPREAVSSSVAPPPAEVTTAGPTAARPPTGWRLRLGPFIATAEPVAPPAPAPAAAASIPAPASGTPGHGAPRARAGHAAPARIGATIGILERLLLVTFVLTDAAAAIGLVVAAKTLARCKQLDDRDFAEYYLLGTLASVAVALGSALLAGAALATLP